MIRKLTGITPPKDTDFLWRYMSFEKFVSILDTKSLFFTSPDKFKFYDPFEGFTPPSVKEHYERTINNIATLEKFQENWHKYTFCSCWHHAEEESMAMWDKYRMHNSGIVIKTTFNDFKNCLIDDYDMFLGKIEYINPYEYPVPQNLNDMSMLYTWYFHKRKPFEYEREFRAIIADYPTFFMSYIDNHGIFINQDTTLENIEFPERSKKSGILFNVDVNKLIREVITSPYIKNEEWITKTVESVVKQYGFDFDVNSSTLLDEPDEIA